MTVTKITVISVFSYGHLSDFFKSDFFFHTDVANNGTYHKEITNYDWNMYENKNKNFYYPQGAKSLQWFINNNIKKLKI
jgi:hypothetical protein